MVWDSNIEKFLLTISAVQAFVQGPSMLRTVGMVQSPLTSI